MSTDAATVKAALLAVRRLQAKLDRLEAARTEPIAVVGIGCRFPGGASGPEALWRLLLAGGEGIVATPPDRWDSDAYYDADADAPGHMYVRAGGFLDDIDGFDPGFFGVAPREAASMDPQQKLVLEVAWEALEHAAIPPATLNRTETGVFLGICGFDHALRLSPDEHRIDSYFGSGNTLNVAAGRLSYLLGLTGPCMAVDTACSSSLVAVHLACQSLRAGECQTALAAGVNAILSPHFSINFCKARMLARDGRCKSFDAAADGYGRGEGCGVVVLRTLSAARAAGDRILAVIRGSAVNQDGPSGGLSIPSGPAQQAVIRRALAAARVPAASIDLLEAHGTGTPLGDPIELEAAAAVLGEARAPDQPLLVGSLKTNLGHLEAAAGIAGLIKTVLALHHATVPPHRNLRAPNTLIPWQALPVAVPVAPTPWPSRTHPRRAAVSAFGYSGTNAHAVLEQAPTETPTSAPAGTSLVMVVSGRTEATLLAARDRLVRALAAAPPDCWPDLAYTATAGRTHFPHRLAVVAASGAEAAGLLAQAQPLPPLSEPARQRLSVGWLAPPEVEVASVLRTPVVPARSWRATDAAILVSLGARPRELDPQRRWIDSEAMAATALLAALYRAGAEIDWRTVQAGRGGRPADLPPYPFQRPARRSGHGPESLAARLRALPAVAHLPGSRAWELTLAPGDPAFLADHRAQGAVVLPGACWVELALAAAAQALGAGPHVLTDMSFHRLLVLPDAVRTTVQISLSPAPGGALFQAHARTSAQSDWVLHATASVLRDPALQAAA